MAEPPWTEFKIASTLVETESYKTGYFRRLAHEKRVGILWPKFETPHRSQG